MRNFSTRLGLIITRYIFIVNSTLHQKIILSNLQKLSEKIDSTVAWEFILTKKNGWEVQQSSRHVCRHGSETVYFIRHIQLYGATCTLTRMSRYCNKWVISVALLRIWCERWKSTHRLIDFQKVFSFIISNRASYVYLIRIDIMIYSGFRLYFSASH